MPARLFDLQPILEAYGIDVEEPSSGSHWKCRRGQERCYTLTAHNGLRSEIPDIYIKGVCRHFGLDPKEFFRDLKGGKRPKPTAPADGAIPEIAESTPLSQMPAIAQSAAAPTPGSDPDPAASC